MLGSEVTPNKPIILRRRYTTANFEQFAIEAAADFGVMFIDSLADGVDIINPNFSQEQIDEMQQMIPQPQNGAIEQLQQMLYGQMA